MGKGRTATVVVSPVNVTSHDDVVLNDVAAPAEQLRPVGRVDEPDALHRDPVAVDERQILGPAIAAAPITWA